MTPKELKDKQLSDIEPISCDECKSTFGAMDDCKQNETCDKEEQSFYKGNKVSWWNFYFEIQVCKRDVFDKFRTKIEKKIREGTKRVEILKIFHQPGAGGTTLGRHLLWHFSQFKGDFSNLFRCCLVNNVVERDTTEQILELWSFKDDDKDKRNPVIVLADNIPEESLAILCDNLDTLSYHNGSTLENLFCLLVVVTRNMTSKEDSILRQALSKREKMWFKKRSKNLEETKSKQQIDSMIAFNVMKEDFNPEYILQTTKRIMCGLKGNEIKLVQHLSVTNTYDADASFAPEVFDKLIGMERSTITKWTMNDLLKVGGPVGLSGAQRRNIIPFRQTWNVSSSESLELLIKHSVVDNRNRVSLVSPLIAKASLEFIKEKEQLDLEKIIYELLALLEERQKDSREAYSTGKFNGVVCNLFNYRHRQKRPFGEGKSTFSNLVTDLSDVRSWETSKDAFDRTDKLMNRCFQITRDPYVGQQRARFCIHFHQYVHAEEAIKMALKESDKVPILYDTFGQIYRTQLISSMKDANVEPKQLLTLACKAIEKFQDAQRLGKLDDLSFYEMEISVGLSVLEHLRNRYKEPFVNFINGLSSVGKFVEFGPGMEKFVNGNDLQCHISKSLRHVEDVFTMTKRPFHERSTFADTERRVREMRIKFQRIYKADSSAIE
ncbi:hypothetical protein DPMN_075797 [Dreissena polymorpha]|uniref:Sterile alpha motif domain-containing protein 9-like n=2 Tax=Dreissena polymorpha TaxID=45954 RepID=A0A9D4BPT2_DREPO|nr:hypothetical protein DPMN_075797 [Dreissena polymorpha]